MPTVAEISSQSENFLGYSAVSFYNCDPCSNPSANGHLFVVVEKTSSYEKTELLIERTAGYS
jgi:hypothetical protein